MRKYFFALLLFPGFIMYGKAQVSTLVNDESNRKELYFKTAPFDYSICRWVPRTIGWLDKKNNFVANTIRSKEQ
jgi:hypothetical protein